MTPGLARLGEALELRVAPRLYQHTRVLTPSPSSRLQIIERLGLPAANVTAVPNGVDDRFSPGGRRARTRRSSPSGASCVHKHVERLIARRPAVRAAVPDLELVIVGQGYERPATSSGSSTTSTPASWVHLRGHVLRRRARRALLRSAWVIASASSDEGWGLSLTEAAACGTPAVATRIAGHVDSVARRRHRSARRRPTPRWREALEAVLTDACPAGAARRRGPALGGRRSPGTTSPSRCSERSRRGPRRMRFRTPAWATGERGRFLRRLRPSARSLALLLFAWCSHAGALDLLEWQRSGDFYDAQAHAWLDGTWQVSDDVLGIERFESRRRHLHVPGPWPALLRLPIVAVTEPVRRPPDPAVDDARHAGRHGRAPPASTGACGGSSGATRPLRPRRPLVAGARHLRGRRRLGAALRGEPGVGVPRGRACGGRRGRSSPSTRCVGCVQRPSRGRFAVGGPRHHPGAVLAQLGRRSAAVAALGDPRRRQPPRSRPGPLGRPRASARGFAAASDRWRAPRDRDGTPPGPRARARRGRAHRRLRRHQLDQVPHAVLDPVLGAGLHDPGPEQRQAVPRGERRHPVRPEVRAHHGRPVPPTRRHLASPARSRSSTSRQGLAPSAAWSSTSSTTRSSIPSRMPALTVLAIVGIVAMFRRTRAGPRHRRRGAARTHARRPRRRASPSCRSATSPTATSPTRVPVLVIAGLVGVHVLLARTSRGREPTRGGGCRGSGWASCSSSGVWVNLSHALLFQRLYSPNVKDDLVAAFVDTRYDVAAGDRARPADPDPAVDEALPLDVPRGPDRHRRRLQGHVPRPTACRLNAVKPTPWNPIERTEAGGRYLRTHRLPGPGARHPPAAASPCTAPRATAQLYAEWQGGAGVLVRLPRARARRTRAAPGSCPPVETHTMDLVVDPRMDFVQVFLDDQLLLREPLPGAERRHDRRSGSTRSAIPRSRTPTPGSFEPLPERNVGVCEELRREAGEPDALRRRGQLVEELVGEERGADPDRARGRPRRRSRADAAAAAWRGAAVGDLERQPDASPGAGSPSPRRATRSGRSCAS